MSGGALWTAGLLLALANFMVVLDTTIANVSVPHIAGGLAVSPSQGTWVITSYSVAEAITVPLTGWLAQRFGSVRVFCTGMISFCICSALCGLAPSLAMLVLFRVLQGLSGGPMIPLSQALLRRIFPPNLQPMAIGLWSMTTVVGPIAGPLLGGALVDSVGWPWVFYINVPVALACAYFSWQMLASRETATRTVPIDGVGLALLVVWVGAMQIMLDNGKDMDWFQSPFIVSLAVIAFVGFLCFLAWEITETHPVVDLKVFRHQGFAASTMIMCVVYGTFFASVVLIPLWLQTNMGYNATWAGRATAVQGLLAVVMSPVVARLTTRFDGRVLVTFGVLLMALVSLWRTTFTPDMTFWQIAAPAFCQGFAMPFFFVPLNSIALGAVNPSELASGAGLLNFSRTMAGAFAVSIATTAWEETSTKRHNELAGILNNSQATLDAFGASGLTPDQSLGQLNNMVQSQSVMLSTNHIFLMSAVCFLIGAAVVWIAPKPKAVIQGGGGH
jgi:DHA2 family multidrug resistance protein